MKENGLIACIPGGKTKKTQAVTSRWSIVIGHH